MKLTRTPRLKAAAAIACTLALLICTRAPAEDAASAAKPFKEEELAALLAPIALYPDTVVAQILMAATYPLEVVEANRWVQKNPGLKGEALASAAQKQTWDQSVQALTAFPDVLKMMDEKLDWTQKIGDAFLAQQTEVMAMVQTLRAKAHEQGNLKSDEHQTVKVEPASAPAPQGVTTTIIIEPADPQVIYVPTYSPAYVYGPWRYPAYPPYYFPYPPAYHPAAGFWWGVSVGVRIGVWGGAWNNHCDWHGGNININTGNINIDRGNSRWKHNPEHRKGASYRDSATAKKYDRGASSRAPTGDAFRGRASADTRDASRGGSGSSSRPGSVPSTSASSRSTAGGKSNKSEGSDALGGMNSGARATSYGSRGGASRAGGGGRRR